MKIERFEDLIVWQKAKELTVIVYSIFQNNKDFGFRDQIQRASVSVMNNIAEGFERKGAKEYSRFLYIAKGSAGEVRSMLYIARELDYIDKETFDRCYSLAEDISKMLAGLVKKVES
ncbi:MAG: four helix bundle protein [Spirochaetae bacterium HGW-Spirochaetae-5]|nr:MAG: four helix bundle protein [Spirochaetae bacterium HGW-Spirochaetae-5]